MCGSLNQQMHDVYIGVMTRKQAFHILRASECGFRPYKQSLREWENVFCYEVLFLLCKIFSSRGFSRYRFHVASNVVSLKPQGVRLQECRVAFVLSLTCAALGHVRSCLTVLCFLFLLWICASSLPCLTFVFFASMGTFKCVHVAAAVTHII